MVSGTPLGGRFGRPEEVASVVVFLASDDARWLTGERIRASGGVHYRWACTEAMPAGQQDTRGRVVMNQENRRLRFGLWSDFRNPTRWQQPSERLYGEILDQIAWGENNGFDDVWLSEHHFIEDGCLASILPISAAIQARTKRIRIASAVLLMPFHNPVRLAEDVAVVDIIAGGRFELGVGTGYKLEEFESFGIPFKERGRQANEALGVPGVFLRANRSA
jgi:hypothetical protein